MDKLDLNLPGFPESLVLRIDKYGKRLEQSNPGARFPRTACVTALLVRALAEVEAQELWERRKGRDRERAPREPDRRQDIRRGRDRYIQHVVKDIEELLKFSA